MVTVNYSVLLIGEYYTKKEFLKKFVPDRYKEEFLALAEKHNAAIAIHGAEDAGHNEIVYDEKKSVLQGSSYCLPAHVTVSCGSEDDTKDFLGRYNYERYDKLIFLSSWQYENETLNSMLDCIPDIICNNLFLEISAVLVESDIHMGATDLASQKKAIEKAFDKYREYFDSILILKCKESALKTIRPGFQLIHAIPVEYCKRFQEWKENLLDEKFGFQYDFEDVLEYIREHYITTDGMDRYICGFSAVSGSKDVAKTYSDNFYKKYYEETEKQILDFYVKNIREICVWEIGRDLACLRRELQERYRIRTVSDSRTAISAPKDRIAYDRLEVESAMKTKFYSELQSFYEKDVVQFLLEHLQAKACRIEQHLEKYHMG